MTDLLKKLNQVLEKDKEAEEKGLPPGEEAGDDAPDEDPVRKVRKAEEQVAYLSNLLHEFVSDTVMLEHPGLFAVERMNYRQANRRLEVFKSLKPSAEHRFITVIFKNDFCLYVRFSAVILSRELEVQAYFCRRGAEAETTEQPIQLEEFQDGPKIDWKKAFESLFLQFLEWYERQRR